MSDKIDVKIGSEEEKYWISVKEQAEKQIFNMQHEILINQQILELADANIAEIKANQDK